MGHPLTEEGDVAEEQDRLNEEMVHATFKGKYDPRNVDLRATDKRCLECSTTYGDDAELCEVCDEEGRDPHLLAGFHTSLSPLGYADDDDYRITGGTINVWEYPINEED